MSAKLIQERLKSYKPQSTEEEQNALKEITQEVALLALSRADFFKKAVFHGGTCLRIFHGLNRFSEDLDFALTKTDLKFDFTFYLKKLADEFAIYGYEPEIQDRSKADEIVKKAFLKDDSIGKQLHLNYPYLSGGQRKIKIKLEVDTNPPRSGVAQVSYHNFPLPFSVTTYNLPSLFAGKIHALLCRDYVKGRDWYDLLWYMRFDIKPNLEFLMSSLVQTGHLESGITISNAWIQEKLEHKIKIIDWEKAKDDIVRFVKPNEIDSISIWCAELFLGVIQKLG